MLGTGKRQFGRYQLLQQIDTGGMAEIHLARQVGIEGFERLLVIKKILPHLATEKRFIEMFFDEARIAAALNHPNVVQIHDLGRENGEYFIAMEYLEGESLTVLRKQTQAQAQPMPQALCAGIVAQVCDGLDYAHRFQDPSGREQLIVHRDVSPQNIIVLFSGVVKLVDFGIAKAASRVSRTKTGALKGKLTYMSPEQCQADPVDARSDIFALGVVLWELLTGKRLFKRETEAGILNAILNGPIADPREHRAGIWPELADLTTRALARDPAQRFESAAAMGAAIRSILQENSIPAGTTEIAAFVQKVLAARITEKKENLKRLLENADAATSELRAKQDEKTTVPAQPVFVQKRKPPKWAWLFATAVLVTGLALLFWPSQPAPPAPVQKETLSLVEPLPVASKPVETKVAKPSPAKKSRPQAPKTGRLKLDTTPWSVIYLGKRKLGMTPLINISLPVGKHRLVAVNNDQGIRQRIPITIRKNKTTQHQITLSP